MPSENIGEYEIEYSGEKLSDSNDWTAHLAIYGPSSNPMHRNNVFPAQRVSIDAVFPTEKAAQDEARKVALSMIEQHAARH
jgi:hypothetical protein